MLNGNGSGGNAGNKNAVNCIVLAAIETAHRDDEFAKPRERHLAPPANHFVGAAQQVMGHTESRARVRLEARQKRRQDQMH